ncbi:kinetochore protein-like protein spc24 [Mytilinidion resinicola]|uniref:Kinetochore protein Spc24 n=1 Tax=Mytilinidion resinicola TaxID=574789 RepID=A0A6A6ZB04_9PEZI|nr:kinetochore protein-like protein spc24 [Mytilinidion resinicola]KAF2817397.1 kinetochore protein-like protein spc24 [Mytilinidion resinicola]
MLLDEDPATLIASCAANFNIGPDRSSLHRINDSLSTLHACRQAQLDGLQSTLQKLSRQQQTLSSTHSLTLSSHNPTNHASEILRLDTEKFKVAKQASDLEIEGERMAAELARLEETLGDLDDAGIEEGAEAARGSSEDETQKLLKLKLYRMLNIDIEAEPATGIFNKVIIRQNSKGDSHIIDIDPKFSRNFYSNYLWGRL